MPGGTNCRNALQSIMNILLILNDPPYGTERSSNALRLAGAMAKRESQDVRVFLMGDAAACAKAGQKVADGYHNLNRMLKVLTFKQMPVCICGTCMDVRASMPVSSSKALTGARSGNSPIGQCGPTQCSYSRTKHSREATMPTSQSRLKLKGMRSRRLWMTMLPMVLTVAACATNPMPARSPAPCADSLYIQLKRQHPDSLSERAWQRLQSMDQACAATQMQANGQMRGMMGMGSMSGVLVMGVVMVVGAAMVLVMTAVR